MPKNFTTTKSETIIPMAILSYVCIVIAGAYFIPVPLCFYLFLIHGNLTIKVNENIMKYIEIQCNTMQLFILKN